MGAECSTCGNDIYEECAYCALREELDSINSLYAACRDEGDRYRDALAAFAAGAVRGYAIPALARQHAQSVLDGAEED